MYVRRLLNQGVPASSILVLSPYTAQINVIREMLEDLSDSLNIASIDSYQVSTIIAMMWYKFSFWQPCYSLSLASRVARRTLS